MVQEQIEQPAARGIDGGKLRGLGGAAWHGEATKGHRDGTAADHRRLGQCWVTFLSRDGERPAASVETFVEIPGPRLAKLQSWALLQQRVPAWHSC